MAKRGQRPGWAATAGATAVVVTVGLGLIAADHPDRSRDATDSSPAAEKVTVEITDTERRLLERAEGVLTARCMRARGFEYEPVAADEPAELSGIPDPDDSRFGLDDPQQARRYGYGLVDSTVAHRRASASDPNVGYLETLRPAEHRAFSVALFGDGSDVLEVELAAGTVQVPRTGCVPEAQRALYGDHDAWSRARVIVDNLRSGIDPVVFEHPRYRDRLSRWTACMRAAGHDYSEPGSIRLEIETEIAAAYEADEPARLEQIAARERELAVAETDCVDRTGLAYVAAELERSVRIRAEAEYALEIRTFDETQSSALPIARELVERE